MTLHVKPRKNAIILCSFSFVLVLAIEIWSISNSYFRNDFLYVVLFLLLINSIAVHSLNCLLRSYTLDTDGIYVKWHIGNKTKFHAWSSFIDNYCMRANVDGEYLDAVVFSKKKHSFRPPPLLIINDGFCSSSSVCIVICEDSHFSPKKHVHCVRKSQFMELLQQCNISVEWNA